MLGLAKSPSQLCFDGMEESDLPIAMLHRELEGTSDAQSELHRPLLKGDAPLNKGLQGENVPECVIVHDIEPLGEECDTGCGVGFDGEREIPRGAPASREVYERKLIDTALFLSTTAFLVGFFEEIVGVIEIVSIFKLVF